MSDGRYRYGRDGSPHRYADRGGRYDSRRIPEPDPRPARRERPAHADAYGGRGEERRGFGESRRPPESEYRRMARQEPGESRRVAEYGKGRTSAARTRRKFLIVITAALLVILQLVLLGIMGVTPSGSCASGDAPNSFGKTDGTNAVGDVEPPLTLEHVMAARAEDALSGMSLEQKVGQLLLLRSHDLPEEEFRSMITSTHAGGVVLFYNDVKNKTSQQLIDYVTSLQSASNGKMLVCVDEEGGTVVRVSRNRRLRASSFTSPQYLYAEGGMNMVRSDTAEKSRFLLGFGVNVNFAPVADVVTSSKGFMFSRSFGRDAEQTSEYVRTVVTEMKNAGIGSCIKHFPGYGNADGDTHNGLVVVETVGAVLRQRDLLPFRAGIEAGCDAVMVTHTIMTAIDENHPASLSPAVIAVLRDELGFDGVTVSDGMDMGAITEYSDGRDVCVAAFLAGIDLICTPADSQAAYDALLAAVNDGTISVQSLDSAVRRILLWKLKLGLYEING